jgi:hypothetical protein
MPLASNENANGITLHNTAAASVEIRHQTSIFIQV